MKTLLGKLSTPNPEHQNSFFYHLCFDSWHLHPYTTIIVHYQSHCTAAVHRSWALVCLWQSHLCSRACEWKRFIKIFFYYCHTSPACVRLHLVLFIALIAPKCAVMFVSVCFDDGDGECVAICCLLMLAFLSASISPSLLLSISISLFVYHFYCTDNARRW